MDNLYKIIENFKIDSRVKVINPINSGLINKTYLVETENHAPDYILQKKNRSVFPNIPAMTDNIVKITEHIKKKIIKEGGDTEREVITMILSKEDKPYYLDKEGDYWTLCKFIPDTVSYDFVRTNEQARKGGEAIGKFQRQLEDFTEPLYPTIEGFHDLKYRFNQWDEILRTGNQSRIEKVSKEIAWVEKRREKMVAFWNLVEDGSLPKRITHNDTKLSNILFDRDGDVLCVIDLDTVMNNTPLADYGDAIRSFANTGAEDDINLQNVNFDIEKYKAYTQGYLSQVKDMLNDTEKKYLHFAPQYITYEQILRFLMDYIDNDKYYKIDYPEHNLIRTRAQMKLLESMEEYLNK